MPRYGVSGSYNRPEKPWPFQRRQKVFEKVDVFEDLSCIQRSFTKFMSCTNMNRERPPSQNLKDLKKK